MPKIFKNYSYNKKTDTFKILDFDDVFADMPIAVAELGREYDEILVVPVNNVSTIVDKKEWLENYKKIKIVVDGENVILDERGQEIWVPKDTDVTKLKYINDRLTLVEPEDVVEPEESTGPDYIEPEPTEGDES